MTEWKLSDEQREVAWHPPAHLSVCACPGAGKTRTIVARYIRRAEALQRSSAAAVLSFTNAAVDEVRSRCVTASKVELLRYPHFVGTLDAFINRFFVLPFDIREVNRPYRVVDSWLSRRVFVKRRGVSCEGFPLDALRIDDTFEGHLDERRIPSRVRSQVLADRDEWEKAARLRRKQLHRMGFISCEDARALAARRIQHTKNAYLGAALSARFAEVIVDEAQDCDDHQLAVLAWFRKAGTQVVTVCDPDQAIYEFRDVSPTALARFNSEAKPLTLTGNFRSGPAICALAGTLRDNGIVDEAVGPQAACNIPVHVRKYDPKQSQTVAAWFKDHLGRLSLSETNAAVLSHRAMDALKVMGRHTDDQLSAVTAGLLLQAARAFQGESTDAPARRAAVTQAEAVILRCLDASNGNEALPEAAEISRTVDLRTLACELLASTPIAADAWPEWCAQVRAAIESIPVPQPLRWRRSAIGTPRSSFPRAPECAESAVVAATVHSAKGREFDAVLMVIPDKGADTEALLAAWLESTSSEAKRVVYVGITRAKRSVSLAVPSRHYDSILTILRSKNVPVVAC